MGARRRGRRAHRPPAPDAVGDVGFAAEVAGGHDHRPAAAAAAVVASSALLDHYDDYRRVERIADLFGPGNRIFELPVEAPLAQPDYEFMFGTPGRAISGCGSPADPATDSEGRTRVLCLARRTLVNAARQDPFDGLRKPRRSRRGRLRRRFSGFAEPPACSAHHAPSRHAARPGDHVLCGGGRSRLRTRPASKASASCGRPARSTWPGSHVAINGSAESSDYPFDLARAFGVRRRNTVSRRQEGDVFFESIILGATQSYILQKRYFHALLDCGRPHPRSLRARRRRPSASGRLYVSRRGAGKRRLLEEAAVEDLFRERGFAVLHPERASIAEQVRAFQPPTWVAGPVGSGLYNSIFSPADVRRIILAPASFYTPRTTF